MVLDSPGKILEFFLSKSLGTLITSYFFVILLFFSFFSECIFDQTTVLLCYAICQLNDHF